MGSNGNAMPTTQPLIPIFKGEGYEFWSIHMKTLLRSQDLWDLVEQGYADPDDEGTLRENRNKDSKTLMRTYGDTVTDQIVEKVLRSLTPKFDHIVTAIEESNDLSIFTELMESLQAHESRINRSMERNEEKVFQFRVQSTNKANIQCYHCKKFGHVKADRCYKNQRANFAAQNEASDNNGKGENKLFMINITSDQKTAEVWFIDSGCSNNMTGLKPVFKELNEREKLKVELGNDKELQVEGKGTMGIETHHENRILTNVQYVPILDITCRVLDN
ncbi:Retrovirus-related Pol polyprotein from transposon TNT 1-94 [Cucumis melo var. makuwa]|uniref:Retrovirus-related Pol polyprotein from transposon TNT 1-94 n=1 Tax=Cucumis melo var. makuwa TaxID=1194695 RepID=A0A5A7V961_CUCMM|nr:Retrovirus-related Pol polyprotein from transposon TNT 1-94 [Cucumis melo var. makuwa]